MKRVGLVGVEDQVRMRSGRAAPGVLEADPALPPSWRWPVAPGGSLRERAGENIVGLVGVEDQVRMRSGRAAPGVLEADPALPRTLTALA